MMPLFSENFQRFFVRCTCHSAHPLNSQVGSIAFLAQVPNGQQSTNPSAYQVDGHCRHITTTLETVTKSCAQPMA
jgi:hypothetical protein